MAAASREFIYNEIGGRASMAGTRRSRIVSSSIFLKPTRLIMCGLFRHLPSLEVFAGRRACGLLMCAAAAVFLSMAGRAHAQAITTQMLIGDAVSTDSLSRYSDIDEAIKRFINRDVLAARQFL